jgi:glycosyltransferase involved in cell wall biosynthesis
MRIGLCMIVKNEAHVIERALRSALARELINTWVIVDTGSTDATMDIIHTVTKELGKPGFLYREPWVNFGINRTQALEKARQHMDFIWMLDADDTLDGDSEGIMMDLTMAAYYITIKYNGITMQRLQLFNAAFPWCYIGAVHEYPECQETFKTAPMSNKLWHTARTEGARSADPRKYLNDAELLQKEYDDGIGAIPTRTVFYLAQSYRDANQVELAKLYYEKRATMEPRGWLQEVYVSFLNLARLSTDIKDKLHWTWQAQELIPERRDAVFNLLTYARKANIFLQEIFALGFAFAQAKPRANHLFLSEIESWQYDDELSIIAYYTGHYNETITFANRALLTCPGKSRERIEKNVFWGQSKLTQ